MNSFDFITAFGHIDEDLVHEAIEFTQAEKLRVPQRRGARQNNETTRYRHRRIGRTLLIAAIIAALLGAAAYAVGVHSGFIKSAFGLGIASREAQRVENASGNDYTLPATERVAVDAEKAEADIGAFIAESNKSVELCGYSYSLGSYAFDENGIGVVTIDVRAPEGAKLDRAALAQASGDGVIPFLFSFYVPSMEGHPYDDCAFLDESCTTETSARYVVYLAPFDIGQIGQDICVRFMAANGTFDEALEREVGNGQRFPNYDEAELLLPASTPIACRRYSGGGLEASLSPLGLRIDSPDSLDGKMGELTICFSDGSEYRVRADGLYNVSVNCLTGDMRSYFAAFNRLVDLDAVTKIVCDGVELTAVE